MRLEVLSDTALRQLEPARLMALITHVQRFIDKAVAYQRRLIAIAESQQAARAVGDACVADTLVRNTGMSRGAARRAARQAKIIAGQPEVAGAMACGDINTDQAEAIARADVGDETRRELVAAAWSEGTDATRERAAAAEIAARNETPEQRFMRQHANRFLRFYNNRDGMVCLEGALDPDSGARLKAKVAAIANRMWRTDKQQPPSRRRSPEQRDIDALCAAASRSSRPTPSRARSRTDAHPRSASATPEHQDTDSPSVAASQPRHPAPSRARSRTDAHPRSASATPEHQDTDSPSVAASQPRRASSSHSASGNAGTHRPGSGDIEPHHGAGVATTDIDADAEGGQPAGATTEAKQTRAGATQAETDPTKAGASVTVASDREDTCGEDLDGRGPEGGDLDGSDLDDGGWADFDDEGKRVLPVLRVSTSLDALLEGLHDAGITDSGETLSAATVRRMACDAEIIPTVLNSKGRVIDVGRRTRRVSEVLRCVLIARDGGCVWPGCDAPPSRCDAHHIKHWADGGPTNADNLALLCHRHHILLHEGRHRIVDPGDAWVVLKPDGTRLHTPLAASGGDNDSRHLREDDPITSCRAGHDAFSDRATAANTDGTAANTDATAANTDGTAATTPRPSRTPSAGLATAAYTDRSAAISDADPTMRSTNGAAQTHPKQLALACGDRNELTVRLTAAGLRHDKVQAGPTVGYSDSRGASHARTAPPALRGSPPVSPANEVSEARSDTSSCQQRVLVPSRALGELQRLIADTRETSGRGPDGRDRAPPAGRLGRGRLRRGARPAGPSALCRRRQGLRGAGACRRSSWRAPGCRAAACGCASRSAHASPCP